MGKMSHKCCNSHDSGLLESQLAPSKTRLQAMPADGLPDLTSLKDRQSKTFIRPRTVMLVLL